MIQKWKLIASLIMLDIWLYNYDKPRTRKMAP